VSFTDPAEPVPAVLRTDEFLLRPIRVADVELDYAAVMDTRDALRQWRQSTWPEDDFTVEDNRKDLVGLEERHDAHRAFTYTVLTPDGATCLGCVYVFPTNATFLARANVVPRSDDEWEEVDAVVFFWVRRSQMETAMDERLLAALRVWFRDDWRLETTVYVTSEPFTQQVGLFRSTDLEVKFELTDPDEPEKRLAFG
jgi:hypothetical protein